MVHQDPCPLEQFSQGARRLPGPPHVAAIAGKLVPQVLRVQLQRELRRTQVSKAPRLSSCSPSRAISSKTMSLVLRFVAVHPFGVFSRRLSSSKRPSCFGTALLTGCTHTPTSTAELASRCCIRLCLSRLRILSTGRSRASLWSSILSL